MDLPIRCSKCKKVTFYIPREYTLNIPIVCAKCHSNKSETKEKTTLSQKFLAIKKGIREDIHPTYFFRSPTEANFARILKLLKLEWKFEERSFTFSGYIRKPFIYLIDFEITKGNKFLPEGFYEIKGYLDPSAKQKFRRLKKCYPEEFKVTTLVIYSKYNKKDIEFCEGLDLNYMFYDTLRDKYKEKLEMWEGK